MIRIVECFGGIGAFTEAVKNLGLDYEVVDYVEFDKFAVQSYNSMNGSNFPTQDITEWDRNLESIDFIMSGSPCFTADTLVLTQEGYKNLIDVKSGDTVLTHDNTEKKVIKFFEQGEKEIWKIKGMGFHELKTTENHKFLTRKRYREWDSEIRTNLRKFEEPKWVECKDLTKDTYLGVAINKNSLIPNWKGYTYNRGNNTHTKNELDLYDSRFWYLCGRYIGDGWTRRRKERKNNISGIIICCGKHKTDKFEEILGDYLHYTRVEDRTTFKYQYSNRELGEFLSQFGKGAKNKFIPKFVMDLPTDLLKSFLDGYMDSDGYISDDGLYKISSISKNLIYGVGQCVAKVYNRPYSIFKTLRKETCIIEGRTVNQNPTYSISWKPEDGKQDQAFYDNGFIWFPIRSVENTNTYENVYDIEVEKSHSFTANGVIVHNCTDVSIAGKQDGADEGSETRSSLMYETIRIVDSIKPKYVLWENVKNLLSKKHKHNFDNYIERMDKLGYNSYYKVLNSKDFGVAQNRERVFTLSVRKDIDTGYEFPIGFDNGLRLKDFLESVVDEKYYISEDKVKTAIEKYKENKQGILPIIKEEPLITSALSSREHRGQGWKEIAGTLCARDYKDPKVLAIPTICEQRVDEGLRFFKDDICGTLRTIDACGDKRVLEPKIIKYDIPQPVKVRKYEVDIEGLKELLRSHKTLSNKEIAEKLKKPVTLVEHWFRKDKCFSIPDEDIWFELKSLLNIQSEAFDKPIVEFEIREGVYEKSNRVYDEQGISPTLTSTNADEKIITNYRMRKLLPIECWRLQGFSDESFYKAFNSGVSNSQLYKQAGNSITVNVLEAILKNIPLIKEVLPND